MAPMIRSEIIGGQAIIEGNFTEEETESIAKGLSGNQTWKPKFEPGKHKFELRLASYQKVEGWEIGSRSRTAEYSRMDLARSCSDQPRRSPRLPRARSDRSE